MKESGKVESRGIRLENTQITKRTPRLTYELAVVYKDAMVILDGLQFCVSGKTGGVAAASGDAACNGQPISSTENDCSNLRFEEKAFILDAVG
jgi:hypothetical protein